MSSSEVARLVLFAVWFVATLVLTSAQLRVAAASPPRTRRYVVAWVACTLALGGLLFLMDKMLGAIDWRRQALNAVLGGAVAAAGLGVGALLTRQRQLQQLHGSLRFMTLALLEALVVALVGYPLL